MSRSLLVALACGLTAGLSWSAQAQIPNSTELLKDFDARVAAYVKLHRASESEVSSLRSSASATEISNRQAQLAASIRQHHPAQQGSIFTPDIVSEFRRLMA